MVKVKLYSAETKALYITSKLIQHVNCHNWKTTTASERVSCSFLQIQYCHHIIDLPIAIIGKHMNFLESNVAASLCTTTVMATHVNVLSTSHDTCTNLCLTPTKSQLTLQLILHTRFDRHTHKPDNICQNLMR